MNRWAEVSARALQERLSPILTAEQLRLYSEQRAQQTASLRTRVEQMRRDAGIGSEELLAAQNASQSAPPTGTVQLHIMMRINGVELTRTVTSTRGGTVEFNGPGGLLIRAQPVSSGDEQLSIELELELYEPANSGRRLVGRTVVTAGVTNSPRPDSQNYGYSSSSRMLRGRKGYLVEFSATATYLFDWNVSARRL
jgi:hypothetical protein